MVWHVIGQPSWKMNPEFSSNQIFICRQSDCYDVTCMQVLKLYAWEGAFQERLLDVRNEELSYIKKAAFYLAGTSISFTCAPVLVRTLLTVDYWGFSYQGPLYEATGLLVISISPPANILVHK